MFSDPSVVAYYDDSNPPMFLVASMFSILRSPSSPFLVIGLVLAFLLTGIPTGTTTSVCSFLSVFFVASHRVFSFSLISSSSHCLSSSCDLHSSFQECTRMTAYSHTGHVLEVT